MNRLTDWAMILLGALSAFFVRVMNGVTDAFLTILGRLSTFLARVMDGAFSIALKVAQAVALFFSRCMDSFIDGVVLLLKNSVFGKSKPKEPIVMGNRLTRALARLCEMCVRLLNRTVFRKRPIKSDFEALFAAVWEEANTGAKRIAWSVSFGLLLLCVGLYVTFVYLLLL